MSATEPRLTIPYVYHLDLSDAQPGFSYFLRANGKQYPVKLHTAETRAAAKAGDPNLASLTDGEITHFTSPVPISLDCAIRVHVAGVPDVGSGIGYMHCAAITCPSPVFTDTVQSAQVNYITTAQALIFHHQDLITCDPTVAPIVMEHMGRDTAPRTYEAIRRVAEQMKIDGPPTETSGWARKVALTGDDGKTIGFFHEPTQSIQKLAGPAMTMVQQSTKNDLRLENKKWVQEQGFSVVTDVPPAKPTLVAFIGSNDANFQTKVDRTTQLYGIRTSVTQLDPVGDLNHVSIHMENHFVRYAAGYIQFLDANGSPLKTPEWHTQAGPAPAYAAEYDDFRFLGSLDPIGTILAIPIPGLKGEFNAEIVFPPKAAAAGIYAVGLGTGANPYPKALIYPGIATGLVNFAIPSLLLAFGAAVQSSQVLYKFIKDNAIFTRIFGIGGIVLYLGAIADKASNDGVVDWNGLAEVGKILFSTAAEALLEYVETTLAAEEVIDQIPFAGWIMFAINVAVGAAQIAETIVAVATSPFAIPNRITTSITSEVTVRPDPRQNAFPQGTGARSYNIRLIHQDTQPSMSVTASVAPDFTGSSLAGTLTNNLGGQVKFQADFYVGNELAASASTAWLPNDAQNAAAVTLYLVEQPVKLTADSVYEHAALLTYQNGAYTWMSPASPPATTHRSLSASNQGNAISQVNGLTLSQRNHQLGYAWKAAGLGVPECGKSGTTSAQLYGLQNVDTRGFAMTDDRFSACGYDALANIVYDSYPPKFLMENGQFVIGPDGRPKPDPADVDRGCYYLDPTYRFDNDDPGRGYHLRMIPASGSAPINPPGARPLSYGRFPMPVDSMIIHPSGQVIGLNTVNAKIMVTTLETKGKPDDQLPFARIFAGRVLNYVDPQGFATLARRPGLLALPIAVSSTYDGTVMILEASPGDPAVTRVQAFDVSGNPVNAFPGTSPNARTPFLDLPSGRTYLDLTVIGNEDLTYLYVLYYERDGFEPADYHLAIYQTGTTCKDGDPNPLVTTKGVSAAHIAVDLFRTLYALNYGTTTDGKGNAAGPLIDSPEAVPRTVPSLSQWLPRRGTS
jgi:hypothetical protein